MLIHEPMSFTVTINISKNLETEASSEEVFELLSDVAKSGSFFPKVEKLVDLGGNTWRWEMERIGIGEHTLQQSIYACKYNACKERKTVTWIPVEEIGNATVSGKWAIMPTRYGSKATLQSLGTLTVNMPGFLELLLSPLIRFEFENLVDRYITNLAEEFEQHANRSSSSIFPET